VLGPKLDDAFFGAHEFHTLLYFREEIFALWSSVQWLPQRLAVVSMGWQRCKRLKGTHVFLFSRRWILFSISRDFVERPLRPATSFLL
jgi:hypothetical protein